MCAPGGVDLAKLKSAGELGSPVLPCDLALIQLKPLRPYAAGELCAYPSTTAPAVAAADAAQRRAGHLSQGINKYHASTTLTNGRLGLLLPCTCDVMTLSLDLHYSNCKICPCASYPRQDVLYC